MNFLRIKKKIYFFKYLFFSIFKVEVIKSAYQVYFFKNYSDTTFKFYITGKYGYKYWNHIQNIDYPFQYIDIGSNQGLYTIGASINDNCKKAYAFEPIVNSFYLLKKNLELNNIFKCKAYNLGISDSVGQIDMEYDPRHSGAASIRSNNQNKSIKINIINHLKLNEIIDDKLPIIIKIDVEGHEEVVIQEILKTKFTNKIKEIYFEIDERWSDYESILKFLTYNGFTKFEKSKDNAIHYDVLASR